MSKPIEMNESSGMESGVPSAQILIPEDLINRRVKKLGSEISTDFAGKNPVMIGVLKGSFVFLADLIRAIDIPITTDFLSVQSYRSGTSTGNVVLTHDIAMNISGKDVLLVEDIVDTGNTMKRLMELLKEKEPASISLCALLEKESSPWPSRELRYVGFRIPDVYVVGYGLDFNGRYRNLPYIGIYTGLEAR